MSRSKSRVVGSEHVIGSPWVVGSRAFATNPAVRRGLPHQSGTFGVVALVVLTAGVANGLASALAGWAAGGGGGEAAASEAGSLNGHGV